MIPVDEISQSERRRILVEDRQRLSTYHQHAQVNADLELGGRFAKVTTTKVTGSEPISRYPKQPASSPFACDPVPAEPPLGFDINAMEPTGEIHEQKASEKSSAKGSE